MFINGFIKLSGAQDELILSTGLPTVTVRGFLNFRTTVDGTVIVFTPASEVPPPSTEPKPAKPSPEPFTSTVPSNAFHQKEELNSQEGMHGGVQDISYASPPQNSLETIKTHVPGVNILDNKIKDPFFQHISDNAVLPSAGQVNNDLDKIRKLQSSQNQYPTGLVTVLGGTFVDGVSTTVYETKVIGTYIDGKYAQILQSTSHIVIPPPPSASATPSLSYSTIERTQSAENREFSNSILKDVPSTSSENIVLNSQVIQPKSTHISSLLEKSSSIVSIISTPTLPSSSSKTIAETSVDRFIEEVPSQGINVIPTSSISKDENITPHTYLKQSETKSPSVTLQSSFVISAVSSTQSTEQPTQTLESVKKVSSLRKFSSYVPVTSTVARLPDEDNTVALTKTHRNNTSRTRFLSPRRPSQTVSKHKNI